MLGIRFTVIGVFHTHASIPLTYIKERAVQSKRDDNTLDDYRNQIEYDVMKNVIKLLYSNLHVFL